MATGKPGTVPLADQAEVRENTRIITLERQHVEADQGGPIDDDPRDPVTGNVVSRAGVETSRREAGLHFDTPEGGPGRPHHGCGNRRRHVGSRRRFLRVEPRPPAHRRPPADQRIARRTRGAGPAVLPWPLDTQPVAADFDDARCNRFTAVSR